MIFKKQSKKTLQKMLCINIKDRFSYLCDTDIHDIIIYYYKDSKLFKRIMDIYLRLESKSPSVIFNKQLDIHYKTIDTQYGLKKCHFLKSTRSGIKKEIITLSMDGCVDMVYIIHDLCLTIDNILYEDNIPSFDFINKYNTVLFHLNILKDRKQNYQTKIQSLALLISTFSEVIPKEYINKVDHDDLFNRTMYTYTNQSLQYNKMYDIELIKFIRRRIEIEINNLKKLYNINIKENEFNVFY